MKNCPIWAGMVNLSIFRIVEDSQNQFDQIGYLADGTHESNCYKPCTSTKVNT